MQDTVEPHIVDPLERGQPLNKVASWNSTSHSHLLPLRRGQPLYRGQRTTSLQGTMDNLSTGDKGQPLYRGQMTTSQDNFSTGDKGQPLHYRGQRTTSSQDNLSTGDKGQPLHRTTSLQGTKYSSSTCPL